MDFLSEIYKKIKNTMIDNNAEKMIHLCAQVQKLSVDLYNMVGKQKNLDEFMSRDILRSSLHLYTNSAELCEKEDEFFRELGLFGGIRMHLMSLNSQLLMCFQLGMISSDVCIDFGYRLELLKNEVQEYFNIAKIEMENKNPFKDFEDEE